MATGLGHGIANAIIWHGRNDHASDQINKGEVVAFNLGAIAFDEVLSEDPIFSIIPNATADGTVGEGGIACGIARDDIPVGKVGEFVVLGLVKAIVDAAVGAVDTVLTVDGSNELTDAANASHQAPCAINKETVSAADATDNVPRWMFVDFISSSFGGALSAANSNTFWGQSY